MEEIKYNLLLPIAGDSHRFKNAGYYNPKSMIEVLGKSILEWSLKSIDIKECKLIFIIRKEQQEKHNIQKFLIDKFGWNINIVVIDEKTDGTLSTCMLAENYINNNLPLIIFTPDCLFQPQFNPNDISKDIDGYLVTFNSAILPYPHG